MQFPDYTRCGVNLAASILRYFGVQASHQSLPELDAVLNERAWRNVVVMLFDGMSADALRRHAPEGGFLKRQRGEVISAVFPSTTTAATTSLISGQEPGEHGWIGWTVHFEDIGKSVDIFLNRVQFTKEPAGETSVALDHFPYTAITELITLSGKARGESVSPYHGVIVNTLDGLFDETKKLMREQGRHYLYAYWPDPDSTMHLHGIGHAEVRRRIEEIDERLSAFSSALAEDELVIVTADHGLVDGEPEFFEDHPELEAMLRIAPSVEPRAAALYVKSECLAAFPRAFREAFGDHYLLYTQKEALESGLFGVHPRRAELPALIGDYFAASTGPHALYLKREHCNLIGMHAGLTEQEMNVPLIILRGGSRA